MPDKDGVGGVNGDDDKGLLLATRGGSAVDDGSCGAVDPIDFFARSDDDDDECEPGETPGLHSPVSADAGAAEIGA